MLVMTEVTYPFCMAMQVAVIDKMDFCGVRYWLSVLIIHWRSLLSLEMRYTVVVFGIQMATALHVVEVGIAVHAWLLTIVNDGGAIGHKDG